MNSEPDILRVELVVIASPDDPGDTGTRRHLAGGRYRHRILVEADLAALLSRGGTVAGWLYEVARSAPKEVTHEASAADTPLCAAAFSADIESPLLAPDGEEATCPDCQRLRGF